MSSREMSLPVLFVQETRINLRSVHVAKILLLACIFLRLEYIYWLVLKKYLAVELI